MWKENEKKVLSKRKKDIKIKDKFSSKEEKLF